jgi:hypothetical protein
MAENNGISVSHPHGDSGEKRTVFSKLGKINEITEPNPAHTETFAGFSCIKA